MSTDQTYHLKWWEYALHLLFGSYDTNAKVAKRVVQTVKILAMLGPLWAQLADKLDAATLKTIVDYTALPLFLIGVGITAWHDREDLRKKLDAANTKERVLTKLQISKIKEALYKLKTDWELFYLMPSTREPIPRGHEDWDLLSSMLTELFERTMMWVGPESPLIDNDQEQLEGTLFGFGVSSQDTEIRPAIGLTMKEVIHNVWVRVDENRIKLDWDYSQLASLDRTDTKFWD